MPPEFNRTEGDGTDSPMVASPYRDQNGRDKFSSPGYANGRHQSPGSHRSSQYLPGFLLGDHTPAAPPAVQTVSKLVSHTQIAPGVHL